MDLQMAGGEEEQQVEHEGQEPARMAATPGSSSAGRAAPSFGSADVAGVGSPGRHSSGRKRKRSGPSSSRHQRGKRRKQALEEVSHEASTALHW